MSGEFLQNDNIVGTFIRNGIIFSNRPRIVEKVLWTNPNSTVDFANQTITLSDSLANYDLLKITYELSRNNTPLPDKVTYIDLSTFVTDNNGRFAFGGTYSSNYTRILVKESDTSVIISDSKAFGGTTVANSTMIPLTIIGVKEEFETVYGTDQYAYQGYKALAASTIPSFTTVAKAKAIWILYTLTSSARSLALTNVNPYTSVVDNDAIYQIDTAYLGRAILTANKFIVTDNEVKTLNALGSQAVNVSIIYTYGEPKDDPPSEETVLWTNPNASATLAATTVTLADDINNYRLIGVKYRQHTSRPEKNGTIYITVEAFKDCQATSNVQRLSFGPISRNNYTTYVRPLFYTNDTTIDIGQATYGTTVGNDYAIPEIIFGVK